MQPLVFIKRLCGIFVITVSLNTANAEMPMNIHDLDHFQIDCSKKQQQVEFLQSLRSTSDQRAGARLETLLTPWRWFTDPEGANRVYHVGKGNYNWLINQILWSLENNCY